MCRGSKVLGDSFRCPVFAIVRSVRVGRSDHSVFQSVHVFLPQCDGEGILWVEIGTIPLELAAGNVDIELVPPSSML